MSGPHLEEGSVVRLLRIDGPEDQDHPRAQVAMGIGPNGPMVLLRVGLLVAAMPAEVARSLAYELLGEAARVELALGQGTAQG